MFAEGATDVDWQQTAMKHNRARTLYVIPVMFCLKIQHPSLIKTDWHILDTIVFVFLRTIGSPSSNMWIDWHYILTIHNRIYPVLYADMSVILCHAVFTALLINVFNVIYLHVYFMYIYISWMHYQHSRSAYSTTRAMCTVFGMYYNCKHNII